MALAEIRVRVPECLRDRQRSKTRDRSLDRLLQRRSTALGPRRQDARRDLCYRQGAGETGGVIKPRNHLSQAAILSRKTGPPLSLCQKTRSSASDGDILRPGAMKFAVRK